MDLIAKLPTLDDSALAVLQENAERLEQTGKPAQKSAAVALLPAIEAELAERRALKLSQAREAAAAKQAAKQAAKPAKRPSRAKAKPLAS